MGQTNNDKQVTACSANKDTLFILDPHAANTLLSVWKQTYNYTEHTFVNNNGETIHYWQTAPTNKPSVIIVNNTDGKTYVNVEHTVIVNHGDTIDSWKWKPVTLNKSILASSKALEKKDKPTGAGLKQ